MSLWASWLPRDSQARMDCIGRCCHKQTGSHNLTEVEDKPLEGRKGFKVPMSSAGGRDSRAWTVQTETPWVEPCQ